MRHRRMNECARCGLDFGSGEAFDRHRVGVFEYDFDWRDPAKQDGRRCLHLTEIQELTSQDGSLVFALNDRGAWSLSKSLARARLLGNTD